MVFAILNKEGKVIKMGGDFHSFLGYEEEAGKGIIANQLNSLYQSRIILEAEKGQSFWKEKVLLPLKGEDELRVNLDIMVNRTEDGAIDNLIGFFSREEERLDLSVLDAICQDLEEGVIIEDGTGTVILTNKRIEEWTGYKRNELIGRDWRNLLVERERVKVGVPFDTHLLQKNGDKFPVRGNLKQISEGIVWANLIRSSELLTRALRIQRKKLLRMTEELARVNKELVQLNEAKSEFVSAVAHDLRTPLTTIIEGISLCEDGTLGEVNPEQKRFLKMVLEDARRLSDFINDLLDLARIESGKMRIKKRRLKITDVCSHILGSFQKVASEKGISLSMLLLEELPIVFADEQDIYRILTNLLGNSVKFTAAGGKIEISGRLASEEEAVIIAVKDTGIGIPKKEQYKVFQKFCRIDREGRPREPGTGLGLVLCKELVERNGGRIWFESEENKGTEFYFSLPIYSEILELRDIWQKVEEEMKRTDLPISLFTITFSKSLGMKGENTADEAIEKIIGGELAERGFYQMLSVKNRTVIFLVVPPEVVYEKFLALSSFFQSQFSPFGPKVKYYIFEEEALNRDEIFNIVLKAEE